MLVLSASASAPNVVDWHTDTFNHDVLHHTRLATTAEWLNTASLNPVSFTWIVYITHSLGSVTSVFCCSSGHQQSHMLHCLKCGFLQISSHTCDVDMTVLQMYCSNSPKKTQRRQAGVGCDCLSNCTCAVVTNAAPCHDCVTIYKQTSTWCTWCSPRRSNDSTCCWCLALLQERVLHSHQQGSLKMKQQWSHTTPMPVTTASHQIHSKSASKCWWPVPQRLHMLHQVRSCTGRGADMILSSISSCKSHHCVQRRHCGIALQYLSYRTCPNIGNLIL